MFGRMIWRDATESNPLSSNGLPARDCSRPLCSSCWKNCSTRKRNGGCRAIVLAQELGREVALLARLQLHQSRSLPVPAHRAQTAQPGRARRSRW